MNPPVCPYCSKESFLVDSKVVYGGRSYGMIWLCSPCQAWVGTHKNSSDHEPLGSLAKEGLRLLRSMTHRVFDSLWKEKGMSRTESYLYLQSLMEMTPEQAHIGKFNEDECQKLIDLLEDKRRD